MDELIAFLENLSLNHEELRFKDYEKNKAEFEIFFTKAFFKTKNSNYVSLLAEQIKTNHLKNSVSREFLNVWGDLIFREKYNINFDFLKKNSHKVELLDYIKPANDNQNILQTFIPSFLGISDMCLSFEKATNFIVFLGENSQGKTSILRAISLSLEATVPVFSLFAANNKLVVPVEYRKVTTNSNIGLKEGNDYKEIIEYYKSTFEFFSLLAYGASRTSIQSHQSMIESEQTSDVSHLMNDEQPLLNIEYWFRVQRDNENEERIKQVFALLCELMPQVDKIDWERNENEGLVLYYYEKKSKYRLRELSAGQKTIVGLIGDMLIRLYKRQSKVSRPQDLEGIILIDELEAHLHPRWQQQFPSILKKTFPRVQFIVTTHSPMIVLGMPKDTLFFNVHKDEAGHVQAKEIEIDIETLRPNQILTSPLFGLENIRHIDNQGVEHLEAGDDYKEVLQRQENRDLLKQLLAEKYKNKSPDA